MSDGASARRRRGKLRALIVDDSPGFRRELRVLLELEEVVVVGEAANGWEAVELSKRLDPDVILMDQNMPALSGVDATRQIKHREPGRRIIFIAAEGAWEQEALNAGAEAYFVKEADLSALIAAIKDPMAALRSQTLPAPVSAGRDYPRLLAAALAAAVGALSISALILLPSVAIPATALILGFVFFLYGLKYYGINALILLATSGVNGNGNGNGYGNGNGGKLFGLLNGKRNGNGLHGLGLANGGNGRLKVQPFVSIHLPLYNEIEVVDRLLAACTNLDYENYEIIIADDSTDQTTQIIRDRWGSHPRIKISHREDRAGFKGGALQVALQKTNPQAQFIAVFDADFLPPPDIIHQFLAYFYGINGNGNGHGNGDWQGNGESGELRLIDDRVAVVQGYQWHVLNASENWITKGIRSEFSGSYVVERSGQELLGSMKMISGSVFMIRADVLREKGWRSSITEDWELTLRLYLDGYKVLYTPFIQAPSECVASFKQLARQRMRWAEGHTFNIKKYFWQILQSPKLNRAEKLEFVYYTPYYLQSALFILGTGTWLLSELILKFELAFWSETLGWALVFANAFSLLLMNLTGLFLERGVKRNWTGIFSFALLTYLLVPYQAYAAVKGLFERHEGGWHRTQKTGVITEAIDRMSLKKHMRRLLPKKKRRRGNLGKRLPAARLVRFMSRPLRKLTNSTSLGYRLASGLVTGLLLLALLSNSVQFVSASPDAFYLHDTNTASGSITFDSQSSNSGLDVSSLSWSHTIGSGSDRKLIVGVAIEEDVLGDEPVTGITYNGVSLTFAQAVTAGTGFLQRVEIWYLDEASLPASGTYTVQVTTTGAVAEINAGAITIAGARAGAPEATATNTIFSSAAITTNITTITDAAWLIDVAGSGNGGSFTPGAGQTERWDISASSGTGASSTKEVATAGATSMSQTHSTTSNRTAHVVIAVAPAGSIGPSGKYMNTTMGTGGFDTGTGADGSVTISTTQNINTAVLGSNRSTYADAVVTTVTANPTGTSISVASTTGLAANDEIILINMQGASGDTADAGNYEFLEIDSVPDGTTLNLKTAVQNSYDGGNFASQSVVVQRVPQWTGVTINSGGALTANAWDGTSGGVIVFRATGTVSVNTGGAINADGLGYRGGAGGNADGGTNGESYDGTVGKGGAAGGAGTGAGGAANNNGSTSTGTRGGGGGGGYDGAGGSTEGGGGGAGGGYGGGGGGGGASGDGSSNSGNGGLGGNTGIAGGGGGSAGGNTSGGSGGAAGSAGGNSGDGTVAGGAVGSGATTGGGGRSDATDADSGGAGGGGGGLYGDAVLVDLFHGSGGGGGGGSQEGASVGRTGGDGGGIIFIIADTLTVSGSITSDGADSTPPASTTTPYGGSGAGSGGSIKIFANNATLGANLVTASGGAATSIVGSQAGGGGGGGGGVGRIRIEADSITGTTNPTASTGGTPGGGPTLTFDTTGQSAYWYTDITYPTGADDASIAAGNYTLNLYFSQLPAAGTSVNITVSVYHTAPDGTDPQEIVTSASTTIDSSTSDPLALNIGSGAQQTFTQSDPRRLRVRIYVDSVVNSGSFTLAYDTSTDPSNLETPSLTVPDPSLLLLLVVVLIPALTAALTRRRRQLAVRLISVMLSFMLALGILANQVIPVNAAPDVFYLHQTATGTIPLSAKVGGFTANAGAGSQSVTGVGFQPKAVLFWITDRVTAGTSAAARFGRGWTDGTNQGAVATAWDDEPAGGSNANNSRSRVVDDKSITLINQIGTVLAEASIVSLDADGFTINWTTGGGLRAVIYLALGGEALTNVRAGGFIWPSASLSYSETGVGFQPDAVLFAGHEMATAFGTTSRGGHGFGIAISPTDRHSDAHRWRDQRTDADSGTSGLTGQRALVFADDTSTPETELDLVSMDADGFTLTKDVGITGEQSAIIYLALQGMSVDRGVLTQPTSTGSQSVSGMSFQPSAVLFDGGDKATTDGFEADAEMVAGVATAATEQAGFWIGARNTTSPYPSDTGFSVTRVITSLTAGTPTTEAQARFLSFNSDGFTLDWTQADATQRRFGWIAFGPKTISPAGEFMDRIQGTGAATKAFNTPGQNEYWYVDETWPTEGGDGGIAAGNYTFNMYFDSLPTSGIQVDSVSTGTTDASSITISHTTSGSDRLMIVGVSLNNDNFETVTSVTYNGVGLTSLGAYTESDDAYAEIWYLVAPATGTHDVLITFSADLQRSAVAGVITFTGVDQATPLGTVAGNNATWGPVASVNVTSAANELVIDTVSCETCTSFTPDASQTQRWNLSEPLGGQEEFGAGSTKPGASSVTMQWTQGSSDHWAITAVSVKPASPSVDITVNVHHTKPDGSDPQLITSASTTIDSSTTDPLALSLGSGAQQTFTSADPRRLRLQVNVTAVNDGGSFTLAYDSAADPSSLDTPTVTVPDRTLLLLAAVIFIPILTSVLTRKRRRLAVRLASVLLSVIAAIGLLANQVVPVSAAPDTFYLHDADASGAWYGANWSYRKQITIDATKVTSDLTDFPVLINLGSDAELAAGAQNDGDDILFTSSDGTTKLSHEIEKFDGATGELVAWVKVPNLSSSVDTTLYMYYGNSTVGAQQDAANVWDSNHLMVQHLQETSGQHVDSTSNNHDSSAVAVTDQNAAGKIAGADEFNGTSDRITIPDSPDFDLAGSFTIEAWINGADVDNNYQGIVIRLNAATDDWDWGLAASADGDSPNPSMYFDTANFLTASSVDVNPNAWTHVLFTWDGTTRRIYVDGVERGNEAGNPNTGTPNQPVYIGSDPVFNTEGYNGIIDEVRISSIARSSDWIATGYNNQSSPATFYSLGTQESPSISPAGKTMNTTEGSGGSTMTFDTAGQNAYWYTDISYPTGNDDGGIAAGTYTLRMYFDQLPGSGGSWDAIAGATSYKAMAGTGWNTASDASAQKVDDTDDGTTTSDSNLDTGGLANKLKIKDRGIAGSNYLRIDTGISLGQPGALTLRLHGSDSKGPGLGCKNKQLWSDFSSIYLYAYNGAQTVDAASETILTKDVDYTVVTGPVSGEGCSTEYVDLDVSNLYAGASGTSTFILRVIAEGGGGIDVDDNKEIGIMAEIFTQGSAEEVEIQVTVSHTATDGSDVTTIVSSTLTTIDANTPSVYDLTIGSGATQTFTAADPRLLRVQINVSSVTGGGSFVLAYDGACTSSQCSSLDTPLVTVPEWGIAFLILVPLVPYLMASIWRRRRLAGTLASVMIAFIAALGMLASQVAEVTAAPDTFYLHPTPTSGITPAGEYMNNTEGSAGSTKAFNSAGQNEYWYADATWPTGNDDATIAAGAYTLNMYFNQLPTTNSPQVDAVSTGTTATSSLTISHATSGTERLMLVGVSINNDSFETVTSITYGGTSLTFVGAVNHQGSGGDDSRVEIWQLVNPPTGTYDVVMTFSADLLRYAIGGVITFTGVDQTTPLGTFASDYGDGASASVTVPSASSELALGVFACETCTSVSFASPSVEQWNLAAGGGNTLGAGATRAGGSPNVTISASLGSSDHWAMGGVSVKPAASAVDITISVHHTKPDGSGATLITSGSTTITASSADPLAVDLGSAALQTFTAADPRRLRLHISVDSLTGGGSFVLDYDGACASGLCSNLDTPVVVVPEWGLALAPLALILPLLTGARIRRRRATSAAAHSHNAFLAKGKEGTDGR